MVKVNGANGQPLDRVKYTSLLNEVMRDLRKKSSSRESTDSALRHTNLVHLANLVCSQGLCRSLSQEVAVASA